ncbi:MAG TPA: hypothetical protein VD997_17475 [Phycisphaerales bacterium]|nr:hypothetical protein [Phycisphaerales bacterium]
MTAQVWPAERFFWAGLDAPGVRAGVLPAGLAPVLQDELPISVDEVHAVGVPVEGGQLLVCAARREDLSGLPDGVLSLRSDTVPDGLGSVSPEMLVGEFEPRLLRRERSQRSMLLAASILLCSGLISVGLLRRAAQLSEHAGAATEATATVLKEATRAGTQDALRKELEVLSASTKPNQPLTPSDASITLAGLLSAWPQGVECDASAVSISARTITLNLSVEGDARPLLAALKAPAGWSLDEPRLSTTAGVTRVTLSLRRNEEARR